MFLLYDILGGNSTERERQSSRGILPPSLNNNSTLRKINSSPLKSHLPPNRKPDRLPLPRFFPGANCQLNFGGVLGCPRKLGSKVSKWVGSPTYSRGILGWNNPLILTFDPITSWDIQVDLLVPPAILPLPTVKRRCHDVDLRREIPCLETMCFFCTSGPHIFDHIGWYDLVYSIKQNITQNKSNQLVVERPSWKWII